ncbi:acyltransferase [Williamsia sp. MIQD14]|uniref:acyltransferase n=1 Tax=Williamsia sp. MIQD14 TaxID=3425703 RepID=UPI003DA02B0B
MTAVRMFLWLLPASRFKNQLLRLTGDVIGRRVHLGPTIVLGPVRFHLADGSSIGTLNLIRGLRLVRLDDDAFIGNLNQFTAAPEYRLADPTLGSVHLRRGAGIINRHYLDCSGRLEVGSMSMIAGIRSVLQTHGLDLQDNIARAGTIVIGERTFTATGVVMVADSYLPDRSFLASGATRTRTDPGDPCGRLYAGTPARPVKDVSSWTWFTRTDIHTPVAPPRERGVI